MVLAIFATDKLASAAPYLWTAEVDSPVAVDGSGTWDTTSNNWIDQEGNTVPYVSDLASSAVFGGFTGLTEGAGVATINLAADMISDTVTFNAPSFPLTSWQLTGSTLYLGNTSNAFVVQDADVEVLSNLTNNGINSANLNVTNNGTGTLTFTGNTIFGVDGPKFTNTNLLGTIAFNNVTLDAPNDGRWLQMSGGNFVFNGSSTYAAGGAFQIGSSGGVTNVTIASGATFTNNIATAGNVNVGHDGASNVTLNVQGTLNLGGDIIVSEGGSAQGTLNVLDGGAVNIPTGRFLYINKNNNNGSSSGIVNLSGGTLTTQGIIFGSASPTVLIGSNTAQLNITGGTLVLTTGNGIHTGDYAAVNENDPTHTATNTQINLGGGTIVANASWSSAMNMTLTGTNGNITFQAASNEVTPTAYDVTLSGVLSGAGGLNKTGSGILTLAGVNAYTGSTMISEGTLATTETGTLGAGTVQIGDGATLTLGSFASINDTGWLMVDEGATINLALGAGTEVIGALVNLSSGMSIAPDTYTADELNALFGGGSTFVGGSDSFLQVTTVVPEPSVIALFGVGLFAACCWHRRRVRVRS